MPVVFSVTRARAVFEIGLLRLRGLGAASLSATATLAAGGIRKATTHAAGLVAAATLAAVVALRRNVSAGLTAAPVLAAFVAKRTAHTAPFSAATLLGGSGIRKDTTNSAGLVAATATRFRVQLTGRDLITSSGNRFVFSDGNNIASVTLTS